MEGAWAAEGLEAEEGPLVEEALVTVETDLVDGGV